MNALSRYLCTCTPSMCRRLHGKCLCSCHLQLQITVKVLKKCDRPKENKCISAKLGSIKHHQFYRQASNKCDLWLFISFFVVLLIFNTFLLQIHDSCCPSFALTCTGSSWPAMAGNANSIQLPEKSNKSKYVSLRPQPRVMKNPDQQTYFVKISLKCHLFSHRKIKVRKEYSRQADT